MRVTRTLLREETMDYPHRLRVSIFWREYHNDFHLQKECHDKDQERAGAEMPILARRSTSKPRQNVISSHSRCQKCRPSPSLETHFSVAISLVLKLLSPGCLRPMLRAETISR